MFVFSYRQLRLSGADMGPEDKEEQQKLHEAIRTIQRNMGRRKIDNHQVVTGLLGVEGVRQSDFVLLTDGYAHVADAVVKGDGSMFAFEAKQAEKTYLMRRPFLSSIEEMHHNEVAAMYAAYVAGETGWMGDELLVALEQLDRWIRFS